MTAPENLLSGLITCCSPVELCWLWFWEYSGVYIYLWGPRWSSINMLLRINTSGIISDSAAFFQICTSLISQQPAPQSPIPLVPTSRSALSNFSKSLTNLLTGNREVLLAMVTLALLYVYWGVHIHYEAKVIINETQILLARLMVVNQVNTLSLAGLISSQSPRE